MNEQNKQEVTMSVDLKKHRIRIYKSTLALLGSPKYLQLLVSPEKMMVAIKGLDKKSRDCHRVSLAVLHPYNSYELYSTQFVDELYTLIRNLDDNFTYRIFGEVIENESIAVFSLKTIQK